MTYVNRELADKYQEFFNFMNREHNLILTKDEMDEILSEAERLVEKLTKHDVMPAFQHSDDMCFHECPDCNCRCNCSNQPCSCCNEA